ncbi:cytochrome c [Roseivivax isoporae]|uniref:Cytochrome c domain-containing protein n=1 Tax=Roseivivax isoporae LMG 25204 TaxID=1449351 RepID=X7F412_9RHOB|nr:c-type cytochrome [Roseivivax isoporae]ETX26814.1 hypothetical protein RISW2_19010 [Roseivivax isoporae LMG 25204]
MRGVQLLGLRDVVASGVLIFTPVAAMAQQSDTAPSGAELVERGAYLSNIAGCGHCHRSQDGTEYVGGYVLNTPFGELVSPNITPATETGIGTWTKEEFEGALRRGVNKDGEPLYPAMPYNSYTKMSDEDIDALYAYFRNRDAVENEVEVIQLPFPFNVRQGVAVWQTLFFQEGRFEPDPALDERLNRGAYLVEGVAHCSSCHTPRNSIGGPIGEEMFQGALVDGWYAPNISGTVGSSLEKFDHETLVAWLRNEAPGNLPSFGPMYEVTESLADAREDDVDAIAAYVLHRAEQDDPGQAPTLAEIPDDVLDAGQAVYEANCVSCHGSDGMGADGQAARLSDNGGVAARRPHNVVRVLLAGVEPRGAYGAMPSFAEVLSNQEISDVTNYIRRSWDNNGPEASTAELVEGLRPSTAVARATELSTSCPVGDVQSIPEGVANQIRDLANRPVSAEELEQPVSGLNVAVDSGYSEKLAAMTAIYCNALSEVEPAVSRAVFLDRQLAFMNAVDDAMRASGESATESTDEGSETATE